MKSNSKKHPETTGEFARKLPESASDLSEKELGEVAGGFNPQPDPPGRTAAQVRLTPNDFSIRANQIGG